MVMVERRNLIQAVRRVEMNVVSSKDVTRASMRRVCVWRDEVTQMWCRRRSKKVTWREFLEKDLHLQGLRTCLYWSHARMTTEVSTRLSRTDEGFRNTGTGGLQSV